MNYYSGMIISKNDKNTIYSANSIDNNCSVKEYYICIPNSINKCSICIKLSSNSSNLNEKESIINEFNKLLLNDNNDSIIYIIPVLPNNLVLNEFNIGDDKLYNELINSIISICNDVFNIMIKNNVLIEQCIYFMISSEYDKSFFDWVDGTFAPSNSAYRNLFQSVNMKTSLKNTDNSIMFDDTTTGGNSGNSLSGGEQAPTYGNKPKVKILIPTGKHGFSNIYSLFLIIVLSLIVGIGFAYVIIK